MVIGETETIINYGEDISYFENGFEIIYYVGVDDRQVLRFDIMDGDKLKIKAGYLFATVTVTADEMAKCQFTLPIIRGQEELGFLHISCTNEKESVATGLQNMESSKEGTEKVPIYHPTLRIL